MDLSVFEEGLVEEGSIVPTSGQGFAFPLGNTGPWKKYDAFEVSGWNAAAIADSSAEGDKPDVVVVGRNAGENGTWDKLYYKPSRYEAAIKIQKAVKNAEKVWVTTVMQFGLGAEEVIPEPLEFELVYSVPKRSYGQKNSQGYQLITLPSIVNAYAHMRGWEVPEFGFRELTDVRNFTPFVDDDLSKYWDKLLLQRAELWKSLGETNMKADTFMGAANKDGKEIVGPTITTSEKLSAALKFATLTWTGKFLARVGLVADPGSERGRIPVVISIFDNEETALSSINREDVAVVSEYSDMHFPESFRGTMSIDEYAEVLRDDTKEVYTTYKTAPIGPKKVTAKAALNAKLAEFELSEKQYEAWAGKLGL